MQEVPKRDPFPQSSMSPLPNYQLIEIQTNKYDERELPILGCLLQKAPTLKEVNLKLTIKRNNEHPNFFLEKWKSLKNCGKETLPK